MQLRCPSIVHEAHICTWILKIKPIGKRRLRIAPLSSFKTGKDRPSLTGASVLLVLVFEFDMGGWEKKRAFCLAIPPEHACNEAC